MAFDADCEAIPRHGATSAEQASLAAKVTAVWETASHCHFNCDFRFNSQSTGMQFTPHKAIGGRAWLSVLFKSVAQEKALVVYANTSFGLLLRWWHSNRQQSGRGNMGKSMIQTLPILDVTAIAPDKLDAAVKIFDAYNKRDLLPAYRLDEDSVRREIDERFGRAVLGLPAAFFVDGGPVDLLRRKLAAEPSIRGSKISYETDADTSTLPLAAQTLVSYRRKRRSK